MNSPTYVKCTTKAAAIAVLTNEQACGRKWSNGDLPLTDQGWKLPAYFRLDTNELWFSSDRADVGPLRGDTILTLEEYFSLDRSRTTVYVGSYEVKNITKRGFNVGCQEVTWEVVEKIMALRPKEEK